MSRPPQLTSWQQHLASRFPDLPSSVVAVLALYSFGMLLARVSGLSRVVLFLATHLGRPRYALRKRLAEFYKEASAKSGVRHGVKRRDLDVTLCFSPLLRWLLSLWSGRCLPLALDVTNLGDRFHVLCISVVVRGIGLPVAWEILPGGIKDPWNPHWQALLSRLRPAVPDDWTVIVLSDRGLESPELFRFVAGLGWHPLMRVKKGGKFRPTGWGRFYGLGVLPRRPGVALEGLAYVGERLPCTLLARWDEGHAEAWLLLTDLPPEAASAVWYAFRAWIEQGFKVIKGGGWDWQNTRMQDPGRVGRLWLVMAVATVWTTALGAEEEQRERDEAERKRLERDLQQSQQQARARQQQQQRRLQKLREALSARRAQQQQRQAARQASRTSPPRPRVRAAKVPTLRLDRVDRRGLAVLEALWQEGKNRLPQQLHPEPWPQPSHTASALTEQEFLSWQT